MALHRLRKGVKREEVLFILPQTSYRFGIALAIFGFEGTQLSQRFLFCCLLPDANQFDLDLAPLSSGDGSQDIALFMEQAALTRGSRKQFVNGSKQAIVSIGDDEIDLGCSS